MQTQWRFAGALTGPDTSLIHLSVYRIPRPEPPAALRNALEPVLDRDGQIRDWRLSATQDSPPEGGAPAKHRPADIDVLRSYRQWRSSYVSERILGDVGTLEGLLRWTDRQLDSTVLHAFHLPECKLHFKECLRARSDASRARDLCRNPVHQGLALYLDDHRAPARGFYAGDEPTVIAATSGIKLIATTSELRLQAELSQTANDTKIIGWRHVEGQCLLSTAEGGEQQADAQVGALLRQLAPAAKKVTVRQLPLTTIFGPLLEPIIDMTGIAIRQQSELQVRRGIAAGEYQPRSSAW